MMKATAQRLSALNILYFATLAPRIRKLQEKGVDVIRLDIGSPDLPPPQAVVEALSECAALPNVHGYGHHKGTQALREAWAELYAKKHSVDLDPETEIVPLVGSKEGIFHLTQTVVESGDVVLLPDPAYVTYTSSALFAGGETYALPLRAEENFLPDLELIPMDILERAKILWLNYPNNPTGALATRAFFDNAVQFARQHNLLLCHDAAYIQVTYDGARALSVLEIEGAKEVAVEFNTLSKSHNMAGWRIGVVVGNTQALEALYTLKSHADSGHFLPIQEAAVAAMAIDQAWLEERNVIYQQRRDLVVKALREIGVVFTVPQGAIYIWCACPPGLTSDDFTRSLLDDAGLSLAPGSLFGAFADSQMRISLCAPEDQLQQAMHRLKKWWKKNAGSRA